MSTPNFSYENILMAKEIDNNDEVQYQEDIDNLKNELSNKGFLACNEWNQNGSRSYEKRIIAEKVINEKQKRDSEGNIEIITIKILVRVGSGYYSGYNVDYKVAMYSNGYEIDLEELTQTEQKTVKSFEKYLTKLLKGYGFTELSCVGIFSNGEAIYKVKNNLLVE